MFPELGLGSKGDFKTIKESPEVYGVNLHSYNILQFKRCLQLIPPLFLSRACGWLRGRVRVRPHLTLSCWPRSASRVHGTPKDITYENLFAFHFLLHISLVFMLDI